MSLLIFESAAVSNLYFMPDSRKGVNRARAFARAQCYGAQYYPAVRDNFSNLEADKLSRVAVDYFGDHIIDYRRIDLPATICQVRFHPSTQF